MIDAAGNWVAVHSLRNPRHEAALQVAQALDGQVGDLLVVIGLGLGHILDALEDRGWPGRVLALEPEPALIAHMLARRDWSDWFDRDRLRMVAAPAFADPGDSWRWFDAAGTNPALIVNPPLERARPEATRKARTFLERLRFGARANADAQRTQGARYLVNTLTNIPALAREGDVASLQGAGAGVPAIVVGAGPSLDRNLPALREVGDRAVIIAVDTALRPLLAAGVTPSLVVALDPSETNARHLDDLPPCADTHLVAEASLDPVGLAPFEGRTFLFSVANHEPWPWLRAHSADRGPLAAWGSVLTSAFDLARQMGCNPIIFAGADLAFTGGRPYCTGTTYELDWRRDTEWGVDRDQQRRLQLDAWPAIEEPDVTGHATPTAAHLIAFRDWLVTQGRRIPRVQIINATGGGILHGEGITQQALDTLIATFPVQPMLHALVRCRHQPGEGAALLRAAARLAQGLDPLPRAWLQFADGITDDRLRDALTQSSAHAPPTAPVTAASVHAGSHASAHFDADWIAPLAANLPLVEMPIPPDRMEARSPGLRRFRFRTTTARLICCVLRLPDDAVREEGQPLQRLRHYNRVAQGKWCSWRDEIVFGSSDGSDPRRNGRQYSVLVPHALADAESRPLDEVLLRRL